MVNAKRGIKKIIKPITPLEISKKKINVISRDIIKAVNELLLEKYNGEYDVTILQKEIIERYKKNVGANAMHEDELFEKRQLNIEEVYRHAGWQVKYDRPAYSETFPASFNFKPIQPIK